MKRRLLILPAVCLLVSGCGIPDMKQKEVQDYLQNRYDRSFTCISSKAMPRGQRHPLDPRLAETAPTYEDQNADDIVDVYEDADGISFHVWHYLRYGVVGSWVVTEDYPVQWLMAKPELYAPLEDAGYTYYNTIGASEDLDAGFALTVARFEDIRPAAELAFSVVGSDAAILPDRGLRPEKQENREENFWHHAVIPQICLVTEQGEELGKLSFRTEQVPRMTDKENFIRAAEQIFIEKTGHPGQLPEEVRERTLPAQIPVYADGEQAAVLQKEYFYPYQVTDEVKRGEKLQFAQLIRICEACGWKAEAKTNKLYLRRGEDTVLFSRRNGSGYDHSVYGVYKNGTAFLPEGSVDDYLENDRCSLTIADFWYLFGITIDVDYEAEEAFIR